MGTGIQDDKRISVSASVPPILGIPGFWPRGQSGSLNYIYEKQSFNDSYYACFRSHSKYVRETFPSEVYGYFRMSEEHRGKKLLC